MKNELPGRFNPSRGQSATILLSCISDLHRAVRSVNRALDLDLVRGFISVASIARIKNLNKSTLLSIVNGLPQEHLLAEELVENSLVGRRLLNPRLNAAHIS